MSSGNKKRKREDVAVEKAAKVRVVGGDSSGEKSSKDTKAKGQSRQEKSERRSIKASKRASRSGNGIEREPELLTPRPAPTKADNLANGDDFVSLSVNDAETDAPAANSHSKQTPSSKSEKKSKPEKKSKQKQKQSSPQSTPPVSLPDGKSKNDRFILFIGNLPYAATNDSITNHFSALQPFTVRHSTDKNTGRSKGFAFLEFENYDKMKTCLKLYHHSIFDPDQQATANGVDDADAAFTKRKKSSKPQKEEATDDKPKSKNARKINVELTAGGGGKSKQRREKIDEKNKKLTEERERRYAKEAAEKAKTEHKRKERPATGANAGGSDDKGDQRGNVHPSRLKRVGH